MSRIATVVIGAGHLGRIHARLANTLEDLQVVGVVDPSAEARQGIAHETGLPTFESLEQVKTDLQAAIVAAPTQWHHTICRELLERDLHVLVEKPITVTTEQAADLVALAEQRGRILQVGHVERFNPAFQLLRQHVDQAKYIETRRFSEYTFRSTDVGVVLDLMIHDLDLVLSLVEAPLRQVDAIGISVMGEHEDIAQARLEFSNGSVAQLAASRCSFSKERTMQVFTDRGYVQADLTSRQVTHITPRQEMLSRSVDFLGMSQDDQQAVRQSLFSDWLPKTEEIAPQQNAILEEQIDFCRAIQSGRAPRVSGQHGARALEVARWILDEIQQHAWYGDSLPLRGPLAMPKPRVVGGAAATTGAPATPTRDQRRAG